MIQVDVKTSDRPTQFTAVCRLFLRKEFSAHTETLLKWHEENLSGFDDSSFTAFMSEFERSAQETPRGRQRRSAKGDNSNLNKLLLFLKNMVRKHRNA